MSLWAAYSHCQSATDFEELKQDAAVLSKSAKRTVSSEGFVLPLPGKIERLVTTPSARLAVDVKAMSAACSLRAGQAAVEARRFNVAKDLLKGILEYHPQSDYRSEERRVGKACRSRKAYAAESEERTREEVR